MFEVELFHQVLRCIIVFVLTFWGDAGLAALSRGCVPSTSGFSDVIKRFRFSKFLSAKHLSLTEKMQNIQQDWERDVVKILHSGSLAFKARLTTHSPEEQKEDKEEEIYTLSLPKDKPLVPPIIVLDPGHGGEDPGAIGFDRRKEKDITLSMALELKKALMKTKKFQVFLTRTKDVFIPLQERLAYAQKLKAALFLSIHADSHPTSTMRGLSVYTLSETASDQEAERLAARENSVDASFMKELAYEDFSVSHILTDLTQRETRDRSKLFAQSFIDILKAKHSLVANAHRSASFIVLKAKDVPSALIEVGYLSNKADVSFLTQLALRRKMAEDLSKAVQAYFEALLSRKL